MCIKIHDIVTIHLYNICIDDFGGEYMYQIISDGSCDLGKELAKQLDVQVVPFYVSLDEKIYQKEIEELNIRDFYQFMIDHPKIFPKTSLPSVQDYIDVFQPYVDKKIDIICICMTTKFSGSYNAAINAKMILEEKYPNCQITVIDSMINTVLQGMLVEEASWMQKDGYSYHEVIDKIEELKTTARIFFTIGSMDYLVHGGRVGKLSGIATGTLGIKPIIVLKEGEIFNAGLARGRKKSIQKVITQLIQYFENHFLNPYDFYICTGYGYDKQEADHFRDQVEQELKSHFPSFNQKLDVRQIGATIGVHTGPHPLGIGIIKKY